MADGAQCAAESVFVGVAGRFARADLRWRMRDHVQGPLAPVARKNGRQLAEYTDEYEVRRYAGRSRHITPTMLAHAAATSKETTQDTIRYWCIWRCARSTTLT
ncbi:hypothetical protein ACFW9I_35780 [[Kitasatospora] papulosa]|uniref:hypothetical protein n=1 Tax=[Kitasatospora] papulosa TaxID=1464011 RepID=UPI003678D035